MARGGVKNNSRGCTRKLSGKNIIYVTSVESLSRGTKENPEYTKFTEYTEREKGGKYRKYKFKISVYSVNSVVSGFSFGLNFR